MASVKMAGYAAEHLELEVNGMAGHICHLQLPKDRLRMDDIKTAIKDASGIAVPEQRLFLGSSELIKTTDLRGANPVQLMLVRRSAAQIHWLEVVSKEGKHFAKAPLEVHRDKEIVVTALTYDWRLFQHVPDELKEEMDLIEAALENGAPAPRVVSSATAKRSKRLARAAVKCDGCALQHFDPEVMDKDIVMAAVGQYPSVLEFLPPYHRNDRDVLLCAVEQDGTCLSYASDELRGDRELVLAAVRQEGMALEYASDDLKADGALVLEALRLDGCALQFAAPNLRADPKVIRCALDSDGLALEFAEVKMQGSRDLVLMAIEGDPRAFSFASEPLRDDAEIIMAALQRALRGYNRDSDREEDLKWMLGLVASFVKEDVLQDLRRNATSESETALILDKVFQQRAGSDSD